jgi:FYVE zinc finger
MTTSSNDLSMRSSENETDSTKSDQKLKVKVQSQGKPPKSFKGSFESMSSVDLGSGPGKKCHVCSKNFNFRKKHVCRFCQRAVCSDHSSRVRTKEGCSEPQRICDMCHQEEEKQAIKAMIGEEVSKIGEELKLTKETNEKLYKVHFDKSSCVNRLEDIISAAEQEHTAKIKDINDRLHRQTQANLIARAELDDLKKKISDSKVSQRQIAGNTRRTEQKTQDLYFKYLEYKKNITNQELSIEKLTNYINKTLDIENIHKKLCTRCSLKVTQAIEKSEKELFEEKKLEEEAKRCGNE